MNVAILKMRTRGTTGPLKAFFTVRVGPFDIDDMRLLVGRNGPFVGFPSKKYTKQDGEDAYAHIVKLAANEFGEILPEGRTIQKNILDAALAEFERRSSEVIEAPAEEDDDLPF